nr:unnamed protein product [Digitaria exilis]
MPEVLGDRSRPKAKEEQEGWWWGGETYQVEASAVGLGALPPKPPWREARLWSCDGLQWIAAATSPPTQWGSGEERRQARRKAARPR